jgi:LuxR family transcriptional regulator, maltose regulon positive regulatory protein
MSFDSKLGILIAETEAPGSAQLRNRASEALTARERDILAMVSQGLSNKRIARALKISPETVKSHVKHILSKLAVSTRGAAAFQAGSRGLLRLPESMPKENAIALSEG